MQTFKLPDLGEGLEEAEIVSWQVGVGDHVVADQPLVSVETDKAVVEVPSPQAGRIAKLYAEPGDIVKVGAPLVGFAGAGTEKGEAGEDAGGIVGEIARGEEVVEEGPTEERAAPSRPSVRATPAVRALARRHGVDLALVSPTGPNETVTRQDVERAARTLEQVGPLEPLRGVRRSMAQRMARAHAEVVPATVVDDADVHKWTKTESPTQRLIRAVAAGCAAEPSLNAWYHGSAGGRRLHAHVDLGVAMDTEDGLFVPVLRDVGNRTREDLQDGLERMKADVQARSVPPEELRGATITLSNFGTIAGRYAAPVVVPPQVAILSAGVIDKRVVPAGNKPAIHRVLPLSLTFDHRAVTGGEAARFLAAVKADLEKAK